MIKSTGVNKSWVALLTTTVLAVFFSGLKTSGDSLGLLMPLLYVITAILTAVSMIGIIKNIPPKNRLTTSMLILVGLVITHIIAYILVKQVGSIYVAIGIAVVLFIVYKFALKDQYC